MKKLKQKNTFNLAIRFTVGVFSIIFVAGSLTILIVGLMFILGAKLGNIHPIMLVFAAFLPAIIIGTALAFVVGKKSLKNLNKIITAVTQIGKGNFDVEITDVKGAQNIVEIADNINIMAKELKGLELLRKDFIQNFSHEFKTPIVSIQGFTKRLLTKPLTEAEKREYLEIILEESTRLADMSTSTLFMSKLDSMARVTDKKEFLLDEQLRRSVLLLEKQIQTKNIDVEITDMPALPFAGDEEMMKQVWVNILSNAVKFCKPGGKIFISAKSHESGTVISISDDGIGMSDEVSSRIFDKYYQGDGSHATEGNGLGLSIVKKIVDLSGGSISVKSKQGEGSTFTVVLPAAAG